MTLSVYIGFRLEINGVYWYFKDLVQTKWCEENGEYQLKQASFGRKLQEKGFDSKQIGKGRTRYRTGINLMDQVLID